MKFKLSIITNNSIVKEIKEVEFNEIHTITQSDNYSPFVFTNNKRNTENSTPQNMLIYDVDMDNHLSLKDAVKLCGNFKSLVTTTKSHQVEKNGIVSDRYRIIIPLDGNIEKEIYKELYLKFAESMGIDTSIDRACNDLARYYYPSNTQLYFYSKSDAVLRYEDLKDLIKPKVLNQSYTVVNDLKHNELDAYFTFKDGTTFCQYEDLQGNETKPIRCFNQSHEDKHPSAFIGRSNQSGKLYAKCQSCSDLRFISYEEDRIKQKSYNNEALEVGTAEPMKKDNQSHLNLFDKFQMTKQRREELKNMKYVIDGLIVENYHTYLMGNAGAGKTTILLHLCFEMVKKGYKVFYFYLDGALNTASKVGEEIEKLNIENEFKLLVDGTMNDYKDILKSLINSKTRLDKTVFILDTFKFLSEDINHKNANKEAMHLIKEVCKIGATFVSLGHTNKDGVKFSGTAEIEQDSDGVLKISGFEDANNTIISTIKKGGRCRYDMKEVSYSFIAGDVLSATKLAKVFDAEAKIREMAALNEDKPFIKIIKEELRLKQSMLQKDIVSMISDFGLSKAKASKLLNNYIDKHWSKTQSKETPNGYEYKVIDDTFNIIDKLNYRLKQKKEDTSPPVEVKTKENDLSLFEA